jgi:hypothetical protein
MHRSIVAALLLVVLISSAPGAQTPTTATVLATMQPHVEIWMPVSQIIPTDSQGRLWWGQRPIQTYRLGWMNDTFIASSRSVTLLESATAASTQLRTTKPADENHGFAFSANGWLLGPGQVIYYDRRTWDADGNHWFYQLRGSGIGSINGTIAAGTKLAGAQMYLITSPRTEPGQRSLTFEVPAGTVLTSQPQ